MKWRGAISLLGLCASIGACASAAAQAPAGKIAFTQGNWDKAIREFRKAVKEHPADSYSWLWLGRALGRKAENSNPLRAAFLVGDIRGAFEKAVELDPKNIDAGGDLLDFYLEAPTAFGGGMDKARAEAEAIARVSPADGQLAQSRIFEKEEKFVHAVDALKSAAKLDPKPSRWRELGEFYLRRKNYPEMEAAFRKAGDSKSQYYLAQGLFEQGVRYPEAEAAAQKFLEGSKPELGDEPTFAQAHLLLGQIAERQGHREDAIKYFHAALIDDPNFKAARKELEKLK